MCLFLYIIHCHNMSLILYILRSILPIFFFNVIKDIFKIKYFRIISEPIFSFEMLFVLQLRILFNFIIEKYFKKLKEESFYKLFFISNS